MQNSQIRKPLETVTIFAKNTNITTPDLKIFKFTTTLVNTTPTITDVTTDIFKNNINSLNTNYYNTDITTPADDCYLLLLFCNNPMVIRVGSPNLQFFYFSKNFNDNYTHYSTTGTILTSGVLTKMPEISTPGFSYFTPTISSGYVEVNEKPSIIETPYCSTNVGIAIDVTWTANIIKRTFGTKTKKVQLNVLTNKQKFKQTTKKTIINNITVKRAFALKTKKQQFKVTYK